MARPSPMMVIAIGVVLLFHAGATAFAMREGLQLRHHGGDAASGDAGEALPLLAVIEAVAGLLLCTLGQAQRLRLAPVQRRETARRVRYDHVAFTGNDFVHFNHRGKFMKPTA